MQNRKVNTVYRGYKLLHVLIKFNLAIPGDRRLSFLTNYTRTLQSTTITFLMLT